MPILTFGEWLPDQPTLGLKGCTVATNVLPDANAYRPMPSLLPFTTAVGGRVLGGIFATDSQSNNYNYCGDASALYALTQGSFSAVTRIGGAYTILGNDQWEFANWGNTVIGVNGHTDLPQQISLGAANFADLSVGVKARHIAVMQDFVVLGNVSDSATNVYRVRWSAINNPTDFAPSAATLSDYQDMPSEGGPVQRVVGTGAGGVVFQSRRISRMTFVGSPLIFEIQPVHEKIGAFAPSAVTSYQNLVFFLSEDGFYSFDGQTLDPIGRSKVDQFFRNDLHPNYSQRISAAVDPINKLVMWAYASHGTSGGNANRLIVYSWAYKKWSLMDGVNVEYILSSITTGYTLDQLDAISTSLENIPVTLDGVQWTGGSIIMSGYDSTHSLGRFNGSALPATLATGEFQLFQHQRAVVTEVWPLIIGTNASLSATVLNRNQLTESVSVGASSLTRNSSGWFPARVNARYHTIQLGIGGDFKQALGVQVVGTPTGER